MEVPILRANKLWECPNCDTTAVKPAVANHQEYHNCPGMAGLSVPMLEHGTKAKVTATEREDYIGKEDVQYDGNNRPIMNVIVEREDGTDCTVYAPTATARREG